jgi:hypothetical protein
MVFIICERLGRRYDNRVTGMRAKRVEVLHVAANNRVLSRASIRLCKRTGIELHTSAPSRTTSYSTSFQPFMLRSTRTWGERLRPRAARSRSSSSLFAKPEPRPPRVNAERMITGYPILFAAWRASLTVDTAVEVAAGMSISKLRISESLPTGQQEKYVEPSWFPKASGQKMSALMTHP